MMPFATTMRLALAAGVVLLGAGLVVYGVTGTRPEPRESCRETILDPDAAGGHPGTLHLYTCPGDRRIGYSLELVDYWRSPPVIEEVLLGSIPVDAEEPPVALRSRWLTPDSLLLEYAPSLRFARRIDTAGPIHIAWLAQTPRP